ncbi:TIGR02444 family protein [Tepidamorphus sp. 3E244]|uniref:TIGR02444 family protein n=1 Tax=Tepidamorphus sp. 3E244 TaxID=3385498 RepID=UPI0038FC403F
MSAADLWRFSLDRYGRDGVQPLCLRLQDEHRADINLVLFALWTGSQQLAISGQQAAGEITEAVADWHAQAVVPLRGVRRSLKNRDFPDPEARDALRAAIQKSEIEAERLEQVLLQALFDAQRDRLFTASTADPDAVMAANAMLFCKPDPDGNDAESLVADLVTRCR